jgi:hypothetical protein
MKKDIVSISSSHNYTFIILNKKYAWLGTFSSLICIIILILLEDVLSSVYVPNCVVTDVLWTS